MRICNCSRRLPSVALALACAAFTAPLDAQSARQPQWVVSAQTGLADTFQMTLGGTFGPGPAWQNRLTTSLVNILRQGDAFSVYGWDTFDLRDRAHNWQSGIGYKLPVLKKHGQTLSLATGVQRWLLPSVKSGANDWVLPGNLTYQAGARRISALVTADSWTLLKSSLPLGAEIYTQGWLQYRLIKREHFQMVFKNGPAHTYSWNFYGTNGNRVIRYQTALVMAFGNTSIEGGFRKQWGLQKGIRDNNFWQFGLTRTFSGPLPR